MSSENDDKKRRQSLLDEIHKLRINADKGREPELLNSRLGTRAYSVSALTERIVDEFIAEHSGGSTALADADTESKRLQLILGVTDYVLGVESIQISADDKAEIVQRVYNELFSYGPLDKLFDDERVTTITLEGADKASVRYGHGELTPIPPLFENEGHLRTIIKRLLLDSGAELTPEIPIIEAGLSVGSRRVRVSVAGPPVSFQVSADIRVHPAKPVSLDTLLEAAFLTEKSFEFIRALANSPHGVLLIGDTESGKTTLLSGIALVIPHEYHSSMIAIERTGECFLPDGAQSISVLWSMEGREGRSFGASVDLALSQNPSVILLDEVRADDAQAIGTLLTRDDAPRQIWVFRGPSETKQLMAALGMVARRSYSPVGETEDNHGSEDLVRALYQRLPFVIVMRRRKNRIQLVSVGEWQFAESADYPDYIELMTSGWEGLELTGKQPRNVIDLPEDFWESEV